PTHGVPRSVSSRLTRRFPCPPCQWSVALHGDRILESSSRPPSSRAFLVGTVKSTRVVARPTSLCHQLLPNRLSPGQKHKAVGAVLDSIFVPRPVSVWSCLSQRGSSRVHRACRPTSCMVWLGQRRSSKSVQETCWQERESSHEDRVPASDYPYSCLYDKVACCCCSRHFQTTWMCVHLLS